MGYERAVILARCGLPAATVVTVWLVGDRSYTGPADGHLDYLAHPLPIPGVAIIALGIGVAAPLILLTVDHAVAAGGALV